MFWTRYLCLRRYYTNGRIRRSRLPQAFCECQPTYRAEGQIDCLHECPYRATTDVPCSGHGACFLNDLGTGTYCTCSSGPEIEDNWYGRR